MVNCSTVHFAIVYGNVANSRRLLKMQHVCHGGPLERITYPRIATEREYLAVTLLELIDISPEMTAMTATLNLQHSNSLFGARPIDVGEADTEGSHLVVSPYTSLPHLLDLSKYPMSSQLFAKALAVFHPIRENYATAEYTNSFNFARVMETLRSLSRDEGYSWRKTEFYVVSFRSQLSLDADPERLFQLDALSHQEAIASGGLLKYWYGVKDRDRRNLATCMCSL